MTSGSLSVDTSVTQPEPAAGRLDLLKFLTCGSVDDGKSTLIGRLLFETDQIPADQLAAVARDSAAAGGNDGELDFALLVDGLQSEREQGITIDVAYRYFRTPRRAFIAADTPGHEQYTRNMATGASNADLAIILIDARKGVLVQTCRHAYVCNLLGIKHVVVCLNKFDLVDYSRDVFDKITDDFSVFARQLDFTSISVIPVSAKAGDNISSRSPNTPWYAGPSLLEFLETCDVSDQAANSLFRFSVQRVCRPTQDFRGYAGTPMSGTIRPGDAVVSALTGSASTVSRIVTADGDLDSAGPDRAVTLVLSDEIDIGRGDLLSPPDQRPEVSDQFAADVIWMSREHMLPQRSYLMRIGDRWVPAVVTAVKHKVDVNTLQQLAARNLELNEIGVCNLATASPIAFDPYSDNRKAGSFILVDRHTHETVAAGMIQFGLRRATNIHVESLFVDKSARAAAKHQKATVLWFTGLSGSGKSTLAKRLEKRLHDVGHHTYVLDGDNIRHGLNRDLGFTDTDRVENIRRIGEVSKLFADAGLIVLCSFISPFRAERRFVRDLLDGDEFVEIFVDAPIEECQRRDPKGLYAKAQAGQIKNFTGIDSPYEDPENAELHLRTDQAAPEALVDKILSYLRDSGRI